MPYACIDPHWGEPRILFDTVRDTPEEARTAAVTSKGCALYSGFSEHGNTAVEGNWKRLEGHGYYIAGVTPVINEKVH
jgi:hypothetical protein